MKTETTRQIARSAIDECSALADKLRDQADNVRRDAASAYADHEKRDLTFRAASLEHWADAQDEMVGRIRRSCQRSGIFDV